MNALQSLMYEQEQELQLLKLRHDIEMSNFIFDNDGGCDDALDHEPEAFIDEQAEDQLMSDTVQRMCCPEDYSDLPF